jgi:4-amino-4-deoxy-L-arabinose transferase-like glycosyltransferase
VPAPPSPAARALLLAALLVGALPRIDAVSRLFPADRDQGTDVRRYYASMAESALHGRGWLPSYPTNFIPPPGQAIFFYALKVAWPHSDYQHLRSVQALVSILTVLLGYVVGSLLDGAWTGVLCAWLLALNHRLSELVGILVPETNYVFLLFAFCALILAALRGSEARPFFLAGAVLGMACLFKPVPTLLAPFLALAVWRWWPRAQAWRAAAALLAGLVVTVSPWLVRNRLHYGRFYPISTNGGTLLALANSPGLDSSRPEMVYWDDLYKQGYYRDPATETRFVGVVDIDGKPEENDKDRAYLLRTLGYMASHPLHFGRNYLRKLLNFLVYPPDESPPEPAPFPYRRLPGLIPGVALLGGIGVILLLLPSAQPCGRIVAIVVVYFLLAGALYHLTRDGRMNLPLRALLSVPASYAVAWLVGAVSRVKAKK